MMRVGKNHIKLLVTMVTFIGSIPQVVRADEGSPGDGLFYENCPFVRYVEDGDTLNVSDEEFAEMSGRVIFPVNVTKLPKNAPLLRQLDREVLPAMNRAGRQLVGVIIRGAASPEGPYEGNRRLGTERAAALVNFVTSRLAVPVKNNDYSVVVDFEDYRTLCYFLSRAKDREYERVKALCDQYLPTGDIETLKRELQEADDGKLWAYLLKNYFPDLRSARIMLLFRKVSCPFTYEAQKPAEPAPIKVRRSLVIPRREFLSVKTNLLLDFAYVPGYDRWCPIPNIAVEYYPRHGHFTFGGSFDTPWWKDYDAHKYFQVRNYQLETRYYLKSGDEALRPAGQGAAFQGFYLQGYVHGGLFGICFDEDRGWIGEGAGAGVGAGYVIPLTKKGHWRLEAGIQFGVFACKYDPYQYENPVDPTFRDHKYYYKWTEDPELFKKRQYRYTWVGPTRIGITLSYDLLYRRVTKRGVSFKNKEEIIYE